LIHKKIKQLKEKKASLEKFGPHKYGNYFILSEGEKKEEEEKKRRKRREEKEEKKREREERIEEMGERERERRKGRM
jgi:hypothetical protein